MKTSVFLIAVMMFALPIFAQENTGLNDEEKEALIKLVFTPKPFAESADVRQYPETLVLFKKHIYEQMKGNIFLGYNFNEGVSVDTKEVQFVHLGSLKGLEKYKASFLEVMKRAWENEGFKFVENSHIQMGVAIVSVVPEKTDESFPGLVLEYYFRNTKQNKAFYSRIYSGKLKGLLYAMLDAAEGILNRYKVLEVREIMKAE